MGYRTDELTELRQPHRTELDRVTGDRPAYIDERGGHARVANSAALAAASRWILGVACDACRDMNRLPNGLLLESAMGIGAGVQPLPSLRRRIERVLQAQELLC